MLTATFADRGKAIFAVGVPLAPAPNRAVDLPPEDGGSDAAAAAPAPRALDADAAAAAAAEAPLLSDRLLTMRAAFMERINRYMGVDAAAAAAEEEDDEEHGMEEDGGVGGGAKRKKKKKGGGGGGGAAAR
jgi:hypothetical protein